MSGSGGEPSSVSAIVVNYECGELLVDCLAALEGQLTLVETIVVDNGSRDGSAAAAGARFPGVRILSPERNLGFAGGANAGAQAARGELLFFLNPDVRVGAGCIAALAAEFTDPLVGVAGPPLAVAVSAAVEYGATLDVIGSPVGLNEPAPPLYVPGCALMTRAALFRKLDGFDSRFFMFVEDVDYCWRVLLCGLDVRVGDHTPARHEGGAVTSGGYLTGAGLASTQFRVALRERNTLATLLKCYGAPVASLVVPVYVLQSLATAGLLAAVGRRRTARDIVGGLWWNVRELRRTLVLRREAQRLRTVPERVILRRMYRGIWKLSLLVRFGVPSVSEAECTAAEADT